MTTFTPGQQVTWLHQPRGGYGYTWSVDAVVVRVTSKRVRIRVRRREELGGDAVEHWVTPNRLREKEEATDGTRERQ